jgi:response regulator RpfG family c-di-GMP phosphodiesterase
MGMAAEAQFHVLAVDDSHLDRKLIEMLLKTSSYHGNLIFMLLREREREREIL